MNGIFADGKLNTHTKERSFQVVIGLLHILRRDIDRMWIQLRQDLGNGFLYQVVHVDSVHILVIHYVEQIVQFIAARIDNAQAIARKAVGKECADKDSYHHT